MKTSSNTERQGEGKKVQEWYLQIIYLGIYIAFPSKNQNQRTSIHIRQNFAMPSQS
jgi:hypothetical protein